MNRVWYSSRAKLNSPDTIHQILMFGNLSEIKSLKKELGELNLKKLFLNYPKKIYTASALNFIKNYILGIQSSIDEQKYLKYTPRAIR
jgi:hypothetical protein